MNAVSLPVSMRVSSQMAPISFPKTQVLSLYGQFVFMPVFGARFFAGVGQAPPFRCPRDGPAE